MIELFGLKHGKFRFTLIELLVVIAIISLLAAMLLPALGRAKQVAYKATCATNQKQCGLAYILYLADNKDHFPAKLESYGLSGYFPTFVVKNATTPEVRLCPAYPRKGLTEGPNLVDYESRGISFPPSSAFNGGWYGASLRNCTAGRIKHPQNKILVIDWGHRYDVTNVTNGPGYYTPGYGAHFGMPFNNAGNFYWGGSGAASVSNIPEDLKDDFARGRHLTRINAFCLDGHVASESSFEFAKAFTTHPWYESAKYYGCFDFTK